MSNVLPFPIRLSFTAVRTFDVRTGPGQVVAVLFQPATQNPGIYRQCQDQDGQQHPQEYSRVQ
jgi:hypothetical protein